MGAFTDFRRWATSPSSCDRSRSSKTRSRPATSHSGCCEDAHRNKRARKQPSFPLGWSGIADISETNFELPPPSPLRRAVQGPHRSSTSKSCERSRVWDETVLVSEMALEEEWTMKPRCYETASDFEGLENFKRRVASLQTKFSYTSLQGEGVSIDSGHPSSTSIVVDEREKEREREGKIESEEPSRNAQPQYKRLQQKAREIDFKLTTLEMEIELATAKLEALQFTKLKDKAQDDHDGSHSEEKLVSLRDALAPLKEDEESLIARVLKGRNRHEVLVMHESSNIEITGQILQCLMPGAWLNDEVINLYFELLKEREKREPKKFLKCHFFNTFFYKKLYNKTNYDYKAVRRWTTQRKIGYTLTDCDKIFVPIHKEIHWCLAIIDIRAKKFQYLDSLKGSDLHVLQVLVRYIVDEAKDKTGQDLDVSTWEQEFVRELPAQENGSDCGVFMIKYADFHSQGLPLSFSQTNMPYFRKRTAKEILGLRAE